MFRGETVNISVEGCWGWTWQEIYDDERGCKVCGRDRRQVIGSVATPRGIIYTA